MKDETKKQGQSTLQQNVVGVVIIALGVFFMSGTIYYLAKN
jgi:hypothetical protein